MIGGTYQDEVRGWKLTPGQYQCAKRLVPEGMALHMANATAYSDLMTTPKWTQWYILEEAYDY